jgi:hypothetical protein
VSGEQGVEEIARAAVVLCADLLRRARLRLNGIPQLIIDALPPDQVDEWGRQVLAWQDQLDNPDPDPGDLALPAVDVPPVRAGDRLILACDGRTWTRIYGEETGWTEVDAS